MAYNNKGGTDMEKNTSYQDITPKNAKEWLSSREKPILLDVRTREEYEQKHIPQSILIPLDVLEEQATSILPNKEETILIYCRSGVRSVQACILLAKLGYLHIYNLGGILDWPYETEENSK